MPKRKQQIEKIAQETFGYNRLRPGQSEVIQAVLDGHDTLGVMPTGSVDTPPFIKRRILASRGFQ